MPVGYAGRIVKTTDGGDSWSAVTSNTKAFLQYVHFCDVNNGMAVGDSGTVVRTTDGGKTWFNDNIPSLHNLFCCYLISPTVAIVTGDSGVTYKNMNLASGINAIQQPSINIMLYPNPASHQLTITGDPLLTAGQELAMDKIAIKNVLGQTVTSFDRLNTTQQPIDVSLLAPGMYFAEVTTDKGIITKKFVIGR